MTKFISINKLISICKNENIDLGKGDPYNRLRYYTKTGLLPFMTRILNDKKEIEGHYPIWVIDTLKEIQKLKKNNFTKKEILEKIKIFNANKKTKDILFTNYLNKKSITYLSIILIVGIIIFQFTFFNTKKRNNNLNNTINNNIILLQTGSGIITANNNTAKVITNKIAKNAKIHITFINDYYPATRHYIEIKDDYFILKTDKPLTKDTIFNWAISN